MNDTHKEAEQAPQLPAVPEQWLHTAEVMEIFGTTSRKTLYNWRKKHALQSKKFGRYVYYLKSEVYKAANF